MKIILLSIVITLLFISPNYALAVNYGEGSYGVGNYNEGEATPTPTSVPSSVSNNTASAPSCNDTKPGSAPWLYGSGNNGYDAINLQFTEGKDPLSKYALEYGTESGKYQYAIDNIGGKGTTSYIVRNLSANTTYYFRVRAGNGCATGDWSNEISAKTLSLTPVTSDNLETEIKETKVRTKEESELKEKDAETKEEKTVSLVSELKIKVVDEKNQPVNGAKVTLYSEPKEALTNEEGIATFENVEAGEHKAVIAYEGYSGEQNIFVDSENQTKELDFTVQIKPVSPFRNPLVISVIVVLVLALVYSNYFRLKRKEKNIKK